MTPESPAQRLAREHARMYRDLYDDEPEHRSITARLANGEVRVSALEEINEKREARVDRKINLLIGALFTTAGVLLVNVIVYLSTRHT